MTLKEFLNNGDIFAKRNGIQITEIKPGMAKAQMTVTEEHMNAGRICQGGALFTLADLVFAALVNQHGIRHKLNHLLPRCRKVGQHPDGRRPFHQHPPQSACRTGSCHRPGRHPHSHLHCPGLHKVHAQQLFGTGIKRIDSNLHQVRRRSCLPNMVTATCLISLVGPATVTEARNLRLSVTFIPVTRLTEALGVTGFGERSKCPAQNIYQDTSAPYRAKSPRAGSSGQIKAIWRVISTAVLRSALLRPVSPSLKAT